MYLIGDVMKLDKVKLMYIFLLLQPIIDLITGITTKFEIGFISLGIIVRGLFILIMLIYLFFFCNTKYKKGSIIYIFVLGIYIILYFFTKTELLTNTSFFINDFIYLFKYLYFLILFITVFNFYFQYKLDYKKIIKIFIINLIMYVVLILIPYLTKTSFSSYAGNKGKGVVGWFYAANDISNILVLLFPFLIYSLDKKIKVVSIIFLILSVICNSLIGTKVAYFGIILGLVFTIFYYLFYIKKKWKQLLALGCILGFVIVAGSKSYVIANIKNRAQKFDEFQETHVNEIDTDSDVYVREDDTKTSIVVFSSRDRLLRNTYDIYKKQSLSEKIFGIGFSNREKINDIRIEKLIEMDFFDILFHGGICLVILYSLPFWIVLICCIKYVMIKKFKIELRGWMYGYLIILGFGVSTLSGHVFSSPSVLIYYTIFFILFLEYFQTYPKLENKKISFLLLHLGNGGIERSTVNTANALVKYYDVELVVAYKLSDEVMYDIDKRIEIKYLIDSDIALRMDKYKDSVRKHDFKKLTNSIYQDYLKGFRIGHLISDFSESVKVLVQRKEKMIDYLKKCKSDIIISTRVEYSTILSKYGNPGSLKIAVEHRHHNNDKKYIKTIKKEYGNIDYLVVLTEGLRKAYSSFIPKNSKTKVICIPNMIVNYPKKLADLNNKQIISIGRIVKLKRVDEIVDISKNFPDWDFVIIGDGDQFSDIKKMVDDKKASNVKLLGAMKNEEALRYLQQSSIFIMTSETEGLPMVLLEAFSYGVPAVCYLTDSGVSDIVDDDENGYIIKNRNQKEMIEDLRELINNKKKRKEFGHNAYQKAKLFNEKEIIKKWLDIL